MGILPPASPQDIHRFVAGLSLQKLAPSTIATYVSGVGFYHKVWGWPDPTRNFLVAKLLEGCRRGCLPWADKRLPITLPLLSHLLHALPSVCSSLFEVSLFKAVFFSYCLQQSLFMFSDVEFCNSYELSASVVFSFRHSKNNMSGPPQLIRLVRSANQAVCPVKALCDYVAIRPPLQGSFFCHFDGSPLTQFQFNAVLKQVLVFSGMGDAHIRAHSFRIGAATTAAAAGIPLTDIQAMGCWRSDAVLRYIQPGATCVHPGV